MSLLHMADFIWDIKLVGNIKKNILFLSGFISSIYKAGWDLLKTDDHNRMFCQNIVLKFTPKNTNNNSNKKAKMLKKNKAGITRFHHLFLPDQAKKS